MPRTSTRRTSTRRSSARRSSRRMMENERLYHVVVVNEKTGGKAYQTATPVTHAEAGTIMGKLALSSSRRPGTHMQLEEAVGRSVSPKGIIYPNGTDRYMLVRDLPKSLQAALDNVGYGKKDIEVKVRETFNPVAMGGQGTRGFVAACKMDDTGTFEVSWGSWGGENAFKRTVEGMDEDVTIPPDVAFIQGSEGGGHPTLARVYVSPRAMNPALLGAPADVSPKEAKILAIFQQLKSSYRAEEFDRLRVVQGEIDSLVERGFLSRNKAGAVSITTEGRNAAAKSYY